MAKLTLSFKDRKLKVFTLDAGDCVVGRDADCTIHIDSLAVQPRHALIRATDDGFSIEAASDGHQVLLNGEAIDAPRPLQEGDSIMVGKHELHYSANSEQKMTASSIIRLPVVGWLQIQSGSHLGRTIRLDKAFTRIGKADAELAVIAHRDDGYYLSHLRGEGSPSVNDEPLGDQTRKLKNGDLLSVGELRVQFFSDASDTSATESPVDAQPPKEERRFSRIPFDMAVTLQNRGRWWQTRLIDVSMHGALVGLPANFDAAAGQQLRLAIHLDNGPVIFMEVEIAHREREHLGLCCRDIDVDSASHLRRLVELNIGEPELLERELSALG